MNKLAESKGIELNTTNEIVVEIKEDPIITKKIQDGKYIVETSVSADFRIQEINKEFQRLQSSEDELNERLVMIVDLKNELQLELDQLSIK